MKVTPFYRYTLICILIILIAGCKSKSEKVYAISATNDFVKIYEKILKPSCGVGGCHDGSFEPDYRTIQSSYNTLVYHPIIKNNRKNEFEYRVVPYDTAVSLLYERITNCCFVDTDDRMPFYDTLGLSKKKIELISKWIMEGAPDIFGVVPKSIETPPAILNAHFFVKDKNHNNIYVNERIQNSVKEEISVAVDPKYDSIYIVIDAKESHKSKAVQKLPTYYLELYSDINYSHSIGKYKCISDTSHMNIYSNISTRSLPKGKLLFMKLGQTNKKDYAYPSTSLTEKQKHDWSFTIKSK